MFCDAGRFPVFIRFTFESDNSVYFEITRDVLKACFQLTFERQSISILNYGI